MKLTYRTENGIRYPNLTLPEQKELPLGKFAMKRREYLMKHRRATYTTLLTECRLTEHLYETEQTANTMMEQLTSEMAQSLGVTEELKAKDQMAWVRQMNSIRSSAEETVLTQLIYA